MACDGDRAAQYSLGFQLANEADVVARTPSADVGLALPKPP